MYVIFYPHLNHKKQPFMYIGKYTGPMDCMGMFELLFTLPPLIMVQRKMGISPIVDTFQIQSFSTEPWLWEKE